MRYILVDVHTPETRSRNMAAIRSKNTGPELKVRKLLHARGFRYRLHNRQLPGNPDLVLPKYNAIIFVHGCFWHLHDCASFHWPSSRSVWWKEKLTANKIRDQRNIQLLQEAGWRIAVIWECSLKGRQRQQDNEVITQLSNWLKSTDSFLTISGAAQ